MVANKKLGDGFEEDDLILLRLLAARLSLAVEDLSFREEHERERRLATVGRLLAGVLHDLKSPIAVVSGYAELLAQMVDKPEGQEYLDHILRSLSRITRMAEEIISFSRGERRVLFSNQSLDEIMDEFIAQIEPVLKANKIDLETHVRILGKARLDRDKIFRVFNNIVMNSVEAMPIGGTITIDVDQLGKEIIFGFSDTGPGIDEEIQGTIFRSFVTKGKGQGTGLGLAVAKEIVEAHGGAISFTTERGVGTTFLVSIPTD